jgi:hypothetical protein
MRRSRWLLVALALTVIGGGVYLLAARNDHATGQFPELKPDLAAPAGYKWEFHDGPDFYTWVLAEPAEAGKRSRSGVGMYFGHHPNPSETAGAEGRVAGRVCGRDVTWLVERSDAATDPWVRRDVILDYDHGRGYMPVSLHVWVWGPSDEVVAELVAQLADITFSTRTR